VSTGVLAGRSDNCLRLTGITLSNVLGAGAMPRVAPPEGRETVHTKHAAADPEEPGEPFRSSR
jgi:hypothetical protein